MDLTGLEWKASGSLPDDVGTYGTGHDYSPDWGLVLSGGVAKSGHHSDKVYQTTEDGHEFVYVADLPVSSSGHCLAIIDGRRFFAAGGDLPSAYIYHGRPQDEWTDVGALPSGRHHLPACGVVQNTQLESSSQPWKVVIAGGKSSGAKVDIYNLETDAWENGGTT